MNNGRSPVLLNNTTHATVGIEDDDYGRARRLEEFRPAVRDDPDVEFQFYEQE